jgi:GTPase SAR1 family protein
MKTCPVNPTHFVKNIYFSHYLNYDFCTICREDISFLSPTKKMKIQRGTLRLLTGEQYTIDFRNSAKTNFAHLVCGDSGSGKTFLAHSMIYEHQQEHADAKVIILSDNDEHENIVRNFNGKIFDDKNVIYFNEVYNQSVSLLKIDKKTEHLDSFISGMINYSNTSLSQQKMLLVLDMEKKMETCQDLDSIHLMLRNSHLFNICFIMVNSDPSLKNYKVSHQAKMLLANSCFPNSIFFCGHSSQTTSEIIKNLNLDQKAASNIKLAGHSISHNKEHQKNFFHYKGADKDSTPFLHTVKSE